MKQKNLSNVLIISIFAAVLSFSILLNRSAAKVAIFRVKARIENVVNN